MRRLVAALLTIDLSLFFAIHFQLYKRLNSPEWIAKRADLSAPGLAQRINTISAANFMKEIFTKFLSSIRESLEKQYTSLNGVLKVFNDILIEDSAVFELNKNLLKSCLEQSLEVKREDHLANLR